MTHDPYQECADPADVPPEVAARHKVARSRATLLIHYPHTRPVPLAPAGSLAARGKPLATDFRTTAYSPTEDGEPEGVAVASRSLPVRVYPLPGVDGRHPRYGDYRSLSDPPEHVAAELERPLIDPSDGWPVELASKPDVLWHAAVLLHDLDVVLRVQHHTTVLVYDNAGTNMAWHLAEALRRLGLVAPTTLAYHLTRSAPPSQVSAENAEAVLFGLLRNLDDARRETERWHDMVAEHLGRPAAG